MANVDAPSVLPRIIKLRDRVRSYGWLIANDCEHSSNNSGICARIIIINHHPSFYVGHYASLVMSNPPQSLFPLSLSLSFPLSLSINSFETNIYFGCVATEQRRCSSARYRYCIALVINIPVWQTKYHNFKLHFLCVIQHALLQ